jgi:hypothetical protein
VKPTPDAVLFEAFQGGDGAIQFSVSTSPRRYEQSMQAAENAPFFGEAVLPNDAAGTNARVTVSRP